MESLKNMFVVMINNLNLSDDDKFKINKDYKTIKNVLSEIDEIMKIKEKTETSEDILKYYPKNI